MSSLCLLFYFSLELEYVSLLLLHVFIVKSALDLLLSFL